MSNSPLVSIIIPCFNAEAYVAEAIQSAIDQTYPHKEVIVIDDGSTDGSLEVIKSFGNAIRWETGPNRGGCAARNRGIELANGEFIQFLDSDDWLHLDKLEKQVPLAMKLESTLVFCDAQSSTTDWSHPHHVRTDDTSDAVIFMLAGGLPTPSPLHRKSWLEEIGGWDESLPCSQERDLHLRIAAHGIRYQRLPEILYNVRRVRGSVSSDGSRILEQHEGIALRLMQTLDAKKELTEQRRRALAAFFARDSRRLIQLGNFSTAKRFTKHASKIHPSGGLKDAYGGSTLWLRYLIGAFATEVISGWLRRLKKI